MSRVESSKSVREYIDEIDGALSALQQTYDDEVFEQEREYEELQGEVESSSRAARDADLIMVWVDQIVREAEGQMLDGVSPGVILARVVTELRDQHVLSVPSSHVLSVVA